MDALDVSRDRDRWIGRWTIVQATGSSAPSGIHPARKRGREYREDREDGPRVREELLAAPHDLRDILDRRARDKAEKADGYDGADGLVIVLNVWSETEDSIHHQTWTDGTDHRSVYEGLPLQA